VLFVYKEDAMRRTFVTAGQAYEARINQR